MVGVVSEMESNALIAPPFSATNARPSAANRMETGLLRPEKTVNSRKNPSLKSPAAATGCAGITRATGATTTPAAAVVAASTTGSNVRAMPWSVRRIVLLRGAHGATMVLRRTGRDRPRSPQTGARTPMPDGGGQDPDPRGPFVVEPERTRDSGWSGRAAGSRSVSSRSSSRGSRAGASSTAPQPSPSPVPPTRATLDRPRIRRHRPRASRSGRYRDDEDDAVLAQLARRAGWADCPIWRGFGGAAEVAPGLVDAARADQGVDAGLLEVDDLQGGTATVWLGDDAVAAVRAFGRDVQPSVPGTSCGPPSRRDRSRRSRSGWTPPPSRTGPSTGRSVPGRCRRPTASRRRAGPPARVLEVRCRSGCAAAAVRRDGHRRLPDVAAHGDGGGRDGPGHRPGDGPAGRAGRPSRVGDRSRPARLWRAAGADLGGQRPGRGGGAARLGPRGAPARGSGRAGPGRDRVDGGQPRRPAGGDPVPGRRDAGGTDRVDPDAERRGDRRVVLVRRGRRRREPGRRRARGRTRSHGGAGARWRRTRCRCSSSTSAGPGVASPRRPSSRAARPPLDRVDLAARAAGVVEGWIDVDVDGADGPVRVWLGDDLVELARAHERDGRRRRRHLHRVARRSRACGRLARDRHAGGSHRVVRAAAAWSRRTRRAPGRPRPRSTLDGVRSFTCWTDRARCLEAVRTAIGAAPDAFTPGTEVAAGLGEWCEPGLRCAWIGPNMPIVVTAAPAGWTSSADIRVFSAGWRRAVDAVPGGPTRTRPAHGSWRWRPVRRSRCPSRRTAIRVPSTAPRRGSPARSAARRGIHGSPGST